MQVGLGLVDELADLLKEQLFCLKVVPAIAIRHKVGVAVGGTVSVHVVRVAHVFVVLQMVLIHIS